MHPYAKRNALLAFMLMAAFVLACSSLGDETEKANKLVGEGNTAIGTANQAGQEAGTKYTALFSQANLADFPDNRDQLKKDAQEVSDVLDKSTAGFREAASKFEEASKLKVSDKFKEYLSVKAQAYRKHADKNEAAKESLKAVSDESVKDSNDLAQRINESGERVTKLLKEAKDLEEKGDKIQQENKDKFKQ
jgi:methyl-accepting chemotaxis protein